MFNRQMDCRLGKKNNERNCDACSERNGCAAAIERKMPKPEGIMMRPSMNYPVQERRVEPVPMQGTTGFC